jgi:hypothetical protein
MFLSDPSDSEMQMGNDVERRSPAKLPQKRKNRVYRRREEWAHLLEQSSPRCERTQYVHKEKQAIKQRLPCLLSLFAASTLVVVVLLTVQARITASNVVSAAGRGGSAARSALILEPAEPLEGPSAWSRYNPRNVQPARSGVDQAGSE